MTLLTRKSSGKPEGADAETNGTVDETKAWFNTPEGRDVYELVQLQRAFSLMNFGKTTPGSRPTGNGSRNASISLLGFVAKQGIKSARSQALFA
jgi:hypothetical protein